MTPGSLDNPYQSVGRGVRLTEAGRLLATRAEEILGRVQAARAELDEHTGLRSGRVRLAAFPSALGTLVPAAAARLRSRHPALRLELTEVEPPEALALPRLGEVDAAVMFEHRRGGEPPTRDDLRVTELAEESLHLVGPADTEWAPELAGHAEADWIAAASVAGTTCSGCAPKPASIPGSGSPSTTTSPHRRWWRPAWA